MQPQVSASLPSASDPVPELIVPGAHSPEIEHAPELIPGDPGYRAPGAPPIVETPPVVAQAATTGSQSTGSRAPSVSVKDEPANEAIVTLATGKKRWQVRLSPTAVAGLVFAVLGFTLADVNYSQWQNRVALAADANRKNIEFEEHVQALRLSTVSAAADLSARHDEELGLSKACGKAAEEQMLRENGPDAVRDPRIALNATIKKLEIRRDFLTHAIDAATAATAESKLAHAQENTENVARNCKHSVVTVELKELGFGTGFVVGPTRVITNFHVVADGADIVVKYLVDDSAGGKGHFEPCKSVKVLAVDRDRDLALLEVEFGEQPPRPLVLQPNAILGEKVCAIGNPGLGQQMLEHTISEGIIAGLTRIVGKRMFHQITAAINPGNSGGPVFNMKGEVIGVATLKATGADNLGFAIPAGDVQLFLDSWETHKIEGTYDAWLMAQNPLHYRLTKIRTSSTKYVTSVPIPFSFSEWGVDNASNLWLADDEGNRLVNYNELTLKSTRSIDLSGRPVAMSINATTGIAYVMLAGGLKMSKVSLGMAKELEVFTLEQACVPLLVALDAQNLITVGANGSLAMINVVTKKFVNLSRAVSIGPIRVLTISVGSRTIDIVGIDTTSGSLVIRTDTVFVIRNLASLLNQADQATDEAKFKQLAEQILKVKYFATESVMPLKVVKNRTAMYCFHEGPGNSCFLANSMLKGPAPYKSSGYLPSMLELLGANDSLKAFSFLENIYCTSLDLHYGASALAIYDLTTGKLLKPLPFVSGRTLFSHDGKILFCLTEHNDGTTHLLRFPWKEVPDLGLDPKPVPTPTPAPATPAPAGPQPAAPADPAPPPPGNP
ncbi:MAG TPA: serine protease [Planctomycetota bacterium]|nr:serine protease [Planctomycetota bacterium]